MKLYDAVLQRLKQIMAEKNASLYSLNKEGGIPKSTLSQVLNKKQSKIKLDLLYDIFCKQSSGIFPLSKMRLLAPPICKYSSSSTIFYKIRLPIMNNPP